MRYFKPKNEKLSPRSDAELGIVFAIFAVLFVVALLF
jgi:hypothetical protein